MFQLQLALLLPLLATLTNALQMTTPPSLVQCQPVRLSWNGGTGPYYPSVIPGNAAGSAALVTFPSTSGTGLTWIVNLPAGTSVTLQVTDSTGESQWASALTVQAGSTDCLNSSKTVIEDTPASTGTAAGGAAPPVYGSASASSAAGAAGTSGAAAAAAKSSGTPATGGSALGGAVTSGAGPSVGPAATTANNAAASSAASPSPSHKNNAASQYVAAPIVALGLVAALAL